MTILRYCTFVTLRFEKVEMDVQGVVLDDGAYTTTFKYTDVHERNMLLSEVPDIKKRSFIRKSCVWWQEKGYFIDEFLDQEEHWVVTLRKCWEEEEKLLGVPGYFDLDVNTGNVTSGRKIMTAAELFEKTDIEVRIEKLHEELKKE